jgi:glycosyltransferase involved in cell wall biosynthesis
MIGAIIVHDACEASLRKSIASAITITRHVVVCPVGECSIGDHFPDVRVASAAQAEALLPDDVDLVITLRSGERCSPALAGEMPRLRSAHSVSGWKVPLGLEFLGGTVRSAPELPPPEVRIFRRSLARLDHQGRVCGLRGDIGRCRACIVLPPSSIEEMIDRFNRAIIEQTPRPAQGLMARLIRLGTWRDGWLGLTFARFAADWAMIQRLHRSSSARPRLRPRPYATGALRGDLPVTVIIPVRNEERNLEACLPRLDRFARVIVADSASTDRTREVSIRGGAELIDFSWNGRFPKKRNWVLRNVRIDTPWILFLDADEYVTPEFCDELARTLPATTHDGFWLAFRNHFMGRYLRHGEPFRKLALIRLGAGEYERIDEETWSHLDMEVHEHPVVTGTTGSIESPIDHDDYKGLQSYISKHNAYSTWEAHRFRRLQRDRTSLGVHFTARQRMKYRLLRTSWFSRLHFLYFYLARGGFLDGASGKAFASLKRVYFSHIRLKILELETRESQTDASASR